MLTSLMIAVAMWGADPGIVFSGGYAPWTKSVVQADAPPPPSPTTQFSSAPQCQLTSDATIVRAQTVTDNIYSPSDQPGFNEFWENPFVKEFLSGMNPFHDEEIHTLPNYYDPFGFQMGTGSFGRQGYRMGWTTYNDTTVLPTAPAFGTTGSMKIIEWNSNMKYSHLLRPGVLFNGTAWFDARWWEGPGGVALPAQVDQISTDLELGLFNDGPWSGQIAFHPQIVSTYEARLDRNAFNFDGRAIAMYKSSPQWSFVGGFAIWNRVDTLFVPHVGAIWTPNDRWEFRVLFPKSRISYYLGNWYNADVWLYGQAEYTAESWQTIISEPQPTSDRMQMTDDRLSLGVRWDTGRYSFFTEGGYVFNRRIKFAGSTPNFDLGDTAMIRAGVRY